MSGVPLTREWLREAAPGPRRLGWYALVANLQAVVVGLYFAFSAASPGDVRYVVYGLLWINVGAVVLYAVSPPSGVDFETRRRAVAVAAAYFGLLAVVGGLVSAGLGEQATGVHIAWIPPGWGPALIYSVPAFTVVLTPAYLVGYAALAYLVYVTVLDASGSAVGGLLGLLSCVSCTWPLVAGVVSTVVGGSGFLATNALDVSYELSTAVFLLTVAVLYWRPGFR